MHASARDLNTRRGAATFPRSVRLTKPAEYRNVFRGAKRIGDRYFTVLARENELLGPRLGLAIARKALPTAVGRNRVKRIIRESFQLRRADLGDWDIVVLAKRAARDAPAEELRRSLARTWQRLSR